MKTDERCYFQLGWPWVLVREHFIIWIYNHWPGAERHQMQNMNNHYVHVMRKLSDNFCLNLISL